MYPRKPKKEKYENTIYNLGSGDSFYIKDFFTKENADKYFNGLMNEIEWGSFEIKGNKVPRLVSIQATKYNYLIDYVYYIISWITIYYIFLYNIIIIPNLIIMLIISFNTDRLSKYIASNTNYKTFIPIYRHPIDHPPPTISWCKTANEIKKITELSINQKLNHALIQLYRDGIDFIGDHSDKTIDIKHHTVIANISLGETRTLVLKSKNKKLIQEIQLEHGSLYVLGWKTNMLFTHGIRRNADPRVILQPRISLTFRDIDTFEENGKILYGQGENVKQEDLLQIFHNMNKKTDENFFVI